MRKNRRRDDINADECAECAHECAEEYSEFAELMLVLSRKVNSAIMVIVLWF